MRLSANELFRLSAVGTIADGPAVRPWPGYFMEPRRPRRGNSSRRPTRPEPFDRLTVQDKLRDIYTNYSTVLDLTRINHSIFGGPENSTKFSPNCALASADGGFQSFSLGFPGLRPGRIVFSEKSAEEACAGLFFRRWRGIFWPFTRDRSTRRAGCALARTRLVARRRWRNGCARDAPTR